MPRDLFGDVTDPSVRVGSRKWYTVPLSLAAHSLVLLAVIVVPLMATGTLPLPHSSIDWMIVVAPALPSPPPARRAEPTPRVATADPRLAPIDPPSTIEKESVIDAGFENAVDGPTDIPGGGVVDGAAVITALPLKAAPPPVTKVRVGGQIKAPEKTHDVLPVYPVVAQAARIQGVVLIEAVIGSDGRVQDARVLRPAPMLEDAALNAVRLWRYSPTLLNGVPVSVIMTVTVRFQLH
ncbi:MAG TPA: energy transducer TonB [Vicinamibacterales bacterium]|nr:energy transducer TonB [Vicinamibacterales bacterium]